MGSPMAFRARRIIVTAVSKGGPFSRPRLEHDDHRIVTIKCSQQMAAQNANAHRPRHLSPGVRQGRSIEAARPMQPRPTPKGPRERRDDGSSAAASPAGAQTRRGVHSMPLEHNLKSSPFLASPQLRLGFLCGLILHTVRPVLSIPILEVACQLHGRDSILHQHHEQHYPSRSSLRARH